MLPEEPIESVELVTGFRRRGCLRERVFRVLQRREKLVQVLQARTILAYQAVIPNERFDRSPKAVLGLILAGEIALTAPKRVRNQERRWILPSVANCILNANRLP